MKHILRFLLSLAALGLLAIGPAQASGVQGIVGLTSKRDTHLELYAQPGDAEPAQRVALADFTLPIPLQEARQGYGAIAVQGGTYWVRMSKVRVVRNSSGTQSGVLHKLDGSISTPGISR